METQWWILTLCSVLINKNITEKIKSRLFWNRILYNKYMCVLIQIYTVGFQLLFLRKGLTLHPWLVQNSPGWTTLASNLQDLPASVSASMVLGLKAHIWPVFFFLNQVLLQSTKVLKIQVYKVSSSNKSS